MTGTYHTALFFPAKNGPCAFSSYVLQNIVLTAPDITAQSVPVERERQRGTQESGKMKKMKRGGEEGKIKKAMIPREPAPWPICLSQARTTAGRRGGRILCWRLDFREAGVIHNRRPKQNTAMHICIISRVSRRLFATKQLPQKCVATSTVPLPVHTNNNPSAQFATRRCRPPPHEYSSASLALKRGGKTRHIAMRLPLLGRWRMRRMGKKTSRGHMATVEEARGNRNKSLGGKNLLFSAGKLFFI